jgi:phospholipid/cholesterol/gamma-HCH transport system permease protein
LLRIAIVTLDLQPERIGPPPIEKGGPYDGRLSRTVARTPASVRGLVIEAGGMLQLVVQVFASAIRHPRGYWSDVLDEMHFTIKRSWLSMTLAIFGFLLTLSVPAMIWVAAAGIAEVYGPFLLVFCCRTFAVWVTTVLVAGVVGTAMTAELGSRKVREELDAMRVMGIDPIRALVLPRMVSVTLMTGMLAIPAAIISVLSMQFAAKFVVGMSSADFYNFLWMTLSPLELIFMIGDCLLSGMLIGTVCCYKGLAASGGATGLGRAVNQAVVVAFAALFVLQLGYNAVALGFFPFLGSPR